MTQPTHSLDALDRHILRLYQSATLTPAQQIGEKVGLSAAAVQRRLKRMREAGVIQAEVAQIDPTTVGLPVTVIVHVDIALETRAHIDAFKTQMRKLPQVQQCWYTTGDADFILVVRVATMAGYESFTRKAFLHDGSNVAKFTSYVVLNEVKSGVTLDISK
jgi:Lrp/AsnC family transcriptional regulator, leucine-responsive regulatory protein